MNRLWQTLLVCALLCLGSVSAQADDRIVLLHLRFDSAGVSLESTTVVPGKLKSRPGDHAVLHGVSFRVLGGDTTLHAGTLDDPRRTVLEVFSEDGTIGRLTQVHASGVTVIRFPYDSRVTRIELSPRTESPGAARPLPLNPIQLDLSGYENKK